MKGCKMIFHENSNQKRIGVIIANIKQSKSLDPKNFQDTEVQYSKKIK